MSRIIESVAGAGKTTEILKMASVESDKISLIVTYTKQNKKEIQERVVNTNCKNIEVITWETFVLNHLLRPYFPLKKPSRVAGIDFSMGEHTRYSYFNGKKIYNERLSDFVFNKIINIENLGVSIFNRLSLIYSHIYLDESQDLSGYDYQIVEFFLGKDFISIVGDPRQNTYSTNHGSKNKKKDKSVTDIFSYLRKNEKYKDRIELNNISQRCPKKICELASLTHESMPATLAKKEAIEGIVKYVPQTNEEVIRLLNIGAVLLSNNIKSFGGEISYLNIGESKGKEFNKVLLSIPKEWVVALKNKDCTKMANISKNRLYVGITRAIEEIYILDPDNKGLPSLFDDIFQEENRL